MKSYSFNILWLSAIVSFCLIMSCDSGSLVSNVNSLQFNDSWFYITPDSSNVEVVKNSLLNGETVAGSVKVNLPHSRISPLAEYGGNTTFYYKRFVMPDYMQGKRISFFFEELDSSTRIWFNGSLIERSISHGMSAVVDVAPISGENTLVMMLTDNSVLASGTWLCAQDSLSFTHVAEDLGFNSGVSVSTFDISGNTGMVAFSANIRNSYSEERKLRVNYQIIDQNRKVLYDGHIRGRISAGSYADFADTLKMKDITCWDVEEPWLYTLRLSIVSDGSIVDECSEQFGFRNFEINKGSIRINGKHLFLTGVNTDLSYPFVGRALSPQAYWRDAWRIKRGGFDLVNVSGGQFPDCFLDACDHYGIVVLDTCDDFRSRVRRNHPCVFSVADSRGVRNYCKDVSCPVDASDSELQAQALSMAHNHSTNRMSRYFADAIASMFDGGDSYNGVMSAYRMPKFAYQFFQTQRDIDYEELLPFAEPFCNILSSWMPGESRGVWVCSNCSSVELFVDNVSVGKKKVNANDPSVFLKYPPVFFDVNCQKAGSIRAIAYSQDGYPEAESMVETPGSPVRIRLVIDECGTLISDNDVVLVHCYVLDNKSNTVLNARDSIEFSVTGTAHLLSPGVMMPEAGVATCLIRTGKSSNDFTISAKCGLMYTVIDK